MIPFYKEQLESKPFITVPVYNEDTKEITSVPQKIDSYVVLPNNKLYSVLPGEGYSTFTNHIKKIFEYIEGKNVSFSDGLRVSSLENISNKPLDKIDPSLINNLRVLSEAQTIMNSFFNNLLNTRDLDKIMSQWQIVKGKGNYLDFLIQCIGFDLIEFREFKTIRTARMNLNEEYFNYIIMDYNIDSYPMFEIDREESKLNKLDYEWFSNDKERKLEEEMKKIKKLPLEERYEYLK